MKNFALFFSLFAFSFVLSPSCKSNNIDTAQTSSQVDPHTNFQIVYENKIDDFFKKDFFRNSDYSDSFEASGVEFFNNKIYIIFDSQAHIFKATLDLKTAKILQDIELEKILFVEKQNKMDIEGIDIHPISGKIRLIEEFFETSDEDKMFALWETMQNSDSFSSRKFIYDFENKSSGMEGIATRSFEGKDYFFILCEGKPCKKNMRDDAGTIEILTEDYEKFASIELVGELQMADYSAIDIRNDSFVLLSQAEGVMLLGRIEDLSALIVESRFQFSPSYCNLEGVSFIDDSHLVLVSDKANDQRKFCKTKERSIHLVKIDSIEDRSDRLPR